MQGPGVSLKIKRLVLLCNQVKSHQEMALGQKKMKRESSALFIKQKKKKKKTFSYWALHILFTPRFPRPNWQTLWVFLRPSVQQQLPYLLEEEKALQEGFPLARG